jgi:diacylglycerol kinase family enzyme
METGIRFMSYELLKKPGDMVFTLNMNAARVSSGIKKVIHSYLPEAEIYLSNNQEEAESHIKSIIKKSPRHIFTGGGDGTTYNFLNLIRKYGTKRLEDYPSIGLLGLGTGNGLASEVNSHNLEYVLNQIREGNIFNTREYNLIETEDKIVHFSTLGLDAQVLNDFLALKEEKPFFNKKKMGLPAYLYAYFTKTAHCDALNNKPWEVRVINESDTVYKISHSRGMELLPVKKGEIIYEGPANLAGVGTASNYGFNFKVFPFAPAKKDFMNLRIVNISNRVFLKNWYALWTGKYENEEIIKDFLVKKVRLQFSQSAPFQTGGDARGYRDEIIYEISDQKVKLIDFSEV